MQCGAENVYEAAPLARSMAGNGSSVENAADGQKMSKRKKNYPDPVLVIDSYGADALRLYHGSAGVPDYDANGGPKHGSFFLVSQAHYLSRGLNCSRDDAPRLVDADGLDQRHREARRPQQRDRDDARRVARVGLVMREERRELPPGGPSDDRVRPQELSVASRR